MRADDFTELPEGIDPEEVRHVAVKLRNGQTVYFRPVLDADGNVTFEEIDPPGDSQHGKQKT